MTQRVQVPEFGNWEGQATIPYTVYFDRAVGGHARGKMNTPSGHNLEKHCSGSSSAEADPDDGTERLTEMEQPNWEVPKFGDWDGVGEDPQYTVYFEKVRKKGGRGHRLYENYPHNSKSAEDPPARKVPIEGKSPQHPKGKKGSVIVHEKPKQERLPGNSAASSDGHKKMPTRQSPDSKHRSAAGDPPRNSSSETKSRSPSNFDISDKSCVRTIPRRNVVPRAVVNSSGSWDESDPSNTSSKYRDNTLQSQSVTDSNSSYHKSPQIKQPNANTCCFPWGRK